MEQNPDNRNQSQTSELNLWCHFLELKPNLT